jgi:hypothetical protein
MRFFYTVSTLLVCLIFLESSHAARSVGVTIEEHENGILLFDVAENGPAYEGGMRDNDIVFSINGKKVKTNPDFIERVKSSDRKTLSFGVFRDNNRKFFNVTPVDVDYRYYRLQSIIPEQVKLADDLYSKKDYKNAFYLFSQAALLGDAYSQYSAGWMMQHGEGTEVNYKAATGTYQMAAKQGHTDSQYRLGRMYQDGDQISANYEKAAHWLYKAADNGHASAQNSLGIIYHNGQGRSVNYDTAIYWYEKSAAQGNENAKKNLVLARNKKKEAEDPWNQVGSLISDGIDFMAEKIIEGIEYVEENPEEALVAAAAVVATAVAVDQMSPDDECFRPDNNCNGWQTKKHRSFYSSLKRYAKNNMPGSACTQDVTLANFIGRIVDKASWYTMGEVLKIALDGDASEIFVDLDQVQSALAGDGIC